MKKTVMPHSLAKALIESSMQHFDDGGSVAPGNGMTGAPPPSTNFGTNSQSNTLGGVLNPNDIDGSFGAAVKNPAGAVGSAVNPFTAVGSGLGFLGQGAQGLAGDFTAQNQYQAQLAPQEQNDYRNLINTVAAGSLSGIPQYQQNLAAQQTLARQLMRQANGAGPNPALNQLNQETGQNAAMTGALMASARGASANPGLIARQAAQQGAATEQQAAGQAATLQAEQELGQEQAAGGLYGQIGNQIQGEQGVNNQLFGAATGAQNTQNANEITNYGNAQGINSQVAQNNANATNKTLGGLLGGGASILSSLFYKGGRVPDHLKHVARIYHPQRFDSGGVAAPDVPNLANDVALQATPNIMGQSQSGGGGGGKSGGGAGIAALAAMNRGGKVRDYRGGGKVPGKDKVPGKNDPRNDTVPAMLSPNEVVLPLSVTQSAHPALKAAEFMAHLRGEDRGYGKVVRAKRSLKERVEHLEKLCSGGMAR